MHYAAALTPVLLVVGFTCSPHTRAGAWYLQTACTRGFWSDVIDSVVSRLEPLLRCLRLRSRRYVQRAVCLVDNIPRYDAPNHSVASWFATQSLAGKGHSTPRLFDLRDDAGSTVLLSMGRPGNPHLTRRKGAPPRIGSVVARVVADNIAFRGGAETVQ